MHYADYKTILSPKNGFNLYRGCTHGCVYCDSRSACYQMAHDFEDVEGKRNASAILEGQTRACAGYWSRTSALPRSGFTPLKYSVTTALKPRSGSARYCRG
jgi:hypothetical protein